jgi:hypothetical protein
VKPEVSIESVAASSAGSTCLLLRGEDPVWIRELFHAIRALRYGPDRRIVAHELPGFAAIAGVELYLHSSVSDLGVLRGSSDRVFNWHRTEQGWARVEELLAPFCSRDLAAPSTQTLDALGEVEVLFSSGSALGIHASGSSAQLARAVAVDSVLTAWVGLDRHCSRHPLQKAVTLCALCTGALCAACAQAKADGRSVCEGGCGDQSYVQFLPDADAEYGSLLLIGTQVRTARELFHGIRSWRRCRGEVLAVHELPGFLGQPHAELYLHPSSQDQGVRQRPKGAAFDWYLTSAGWEKVEDTLAQGCDRYAEGATLHLQETGEFQVILGWDW